MKKMLLGCFLLSTGIFASSDKYLEVKVGTDLYSKYSPFIFNGYEKVLAKNTINDSFNISIEGMIKKTDNLDLGLGLAYENHSTRKDEGYKGGEYSSIPVYFITKYNFNIDKNYTPYVKFNLGYAYNKEDKDIERLNGTKVTDTNIKNGSYFALGGGVEYNNFIAELMYSVIHATLFDEVNGRTDRTSANYNSLKLSVGYKFNL